MTDRTHDAAGLSSIIAHCEGERRPAHAARAAPPAPAGARHDGRMEAHEAVLPAARDLLEGRAAGDTRAVDELEAADLMVTALAVRHGQTPLGFRERYQADAEAALRALLTRYHLVRKP